MTKEKSILQKEEAGRKKRRKVEIKKRNTFPPNLKAQKAKLGRHCQNKNCCPEL